MSKKSELSKIKKIYGEKFMHMCREMFPTILEDEGKLLEILESRFARNCSGLCEAITRENLQYDFKNLIYSDYDKMRESKEEKQEEEIRTPYEILDEAGYELHECTSEDEIQSFRKYYAPNEVLCTIYNGGRLNTDVVYFAVKKDVDEIKRENFSEPKKEDEYSLSVLGIQFDKREKSDVQIISRYNHTVPNPNCTLSNNLENLAPGLTESFSKVLEERGYYLDGEKNGAFEIPGYTMTKDGKYYKYNMEVNGAYYCPGNIVIKDGEAKSVGDPANTLLVDYFVVDMKEKKLTSLIDIKAMKDSFPDSVGDIKNIRVEKADEGKKIIIEKEEGKPVEIGINENSEITEYKNENVEEIGDFFLIWGEKLRKIDIPNVKNVGDYFLYRNNGLEEIELPQTEKVGNNFLVWNKTISRLEMSNVKRIGNDFLIGNKGLTEISLSSVEEVGCSFIRSNETINKVDMSSIKKIGNGFLQNNIDLREIELPNVEEIGKSFMELNANLERIEIPKARIIGDGFLDENEALKEIELPKVEQIGNNFLRWNKCIEKVNFPKVKRVGDNFLSNAKEITEISLPQAEEIGYDFGYNGRNLKKVNLPQAKDIKQGFLGKNTSLEEIHVLEDVNIENLLNRELYDKLKSRGTIEDEKSVEEMHDIDEVKEVVEKTKTKSIINFFNKCKKILRRERNQDKEKE